LTFLSIVMGTVLFGVVSQVTGNLRQPVLATSIFFILGLLILLFTKIEAKSLPSEEVL
jgi:MFS-type transporter involved in bile tolerance (Atg22 family)